MAAGLLELLTGTDPGPASTGYQGLWIDANGNIWKADASGVDVLIYSNYQCRCYNNANITIADNTATLMTFNTDTYDPAGMHDTGSNTGRITFAVAGKYHVGACIRWASNGTGYRQIALQINASTNIALVQSPPNAAQTTAMIISCDYVFAAGDYANVNVLQNSGGNLDISASGVTHPSFWAHWIGNPGT